MKYKHVVITRPGRPEVLQLVADELVEPGAGQIRVKILATGVAFTDVMMRESVYPGAVTASIYAFLLPMPCSCRRVLTRLKR